MFLRMREAESSTKLNSLQQALRISLKENALKIGDFREIAITVLRAGVGRSNRPAPTKSLPI
jgi:hypothetical protein